MSNGSFPIKLGKSFAHALNTEPRYLSQLKLASDEHVDVRFGVMGVNRAGATGLSLRRTDAPFAKECTNFQGSSSDLSRSTRQFVLLFNATDQCYYLEHLHAVTTVRTMVAHDMVGLAINTFGVETAVSIDESGVRVVEVEAVPRSRGRPKTQLPSDHKDQLKEAKTKTNNPPKKRKPKVEPAAVQKATQVHDTRWEDQYSEDDDLFADEAASSKKRKEPRQATKTVKDASTTPVQLHSVPNDDALAASEDQAMWEDFNNPVFLPPPNTNEDDVLGSISHSRAHASAHVHRTTRDEIDDIFASDEE